MNEFQSLWSKLIKDKKESSETQTNESDESSPVKAAEMVSEGFFDHELTETEKKYAGPATHYAMGGTSGLIYGATAEMMPIAKTGAGMPFGAAVWLIADEIAVPALGLSKSPSEYPVSNHAYALASHLVYGMTTETVRGVVRNALG